MEQHEFRGRWRACFRKAAILVHAFCQISTLTPCQEEWTSNRQSLDASSQGQRGMRRVPLIGPRTTGFQGLRVLKLALVKRMQLATRARGLHLIGVSLLDADTFVLVSVS